MLSLKHTLNDGRIVEIVPLSAKIPTKWLLDYINGIIEEDGYLQYDEKFNISQQREWKKNTLLGINEGKQIYFAVIYGKRIVGSCSAKREIGRGRKNVVIGIAISKELRGAGLGEFLMEKTIETVKQEFEPDNIYLYVASANAAARGLYKKLGFVEFARYPKWWKYGGKLIDLIGMKQ